MPIFRLFRVLHNYWLITANRWFTITIDFGKDHITFSQKHILIPNLKENKFLERKVTKNILKSISPISRDVKFEKKNYESLRETKKTFKNAEYISEKHDPHLQTKQIFKSQITACTRNISKTLWISSYIHAPNEIYSSWRSERR